MKSLGMLLRLAKQQLEMLRKALARELARERDVEGRILAHGEMVRSEQQLALRDHESALAYQTYAPRARQERGALEAERELVVLEIDRLRGLIGEAHVEARKFERLIELEEAREQAAENKRENDELDEFVTLSRSNRK